ncbi:MAG TPA: CAP domain-containing protein [Ilumatobacter sp.]|nr:CAP domain-containing protein [Ilumatobacter sp.]
MLFTKRIVGGLLVAATLTAGITTADALARIGSAATASKRAARVDPPLASSNTGDLTLVLGMVNTARRNAGLAPVAWDARVAVAAQTHSVDMAAMNRLTHAGSDGSDAGDRLLRAGFVWRAWGENVAAGQSSVRLAFDAWMSSAGHRAQILGTFTVIGLGAAEGSSGTIYWTLDLAR